MVNGYERHQMLIRNGGQDPDGDKMDQAICLVFGHFVVRIQEGWEGRACGKDFLGDQKCKMPTELKHL